MHLLRQLVGVCFHHRTCVVVVHTIVVKMKCVVGDIIAEKIHLNYVSMSCLFFRVRVCIVIPSLNRQNSLPYSLSRSDET